MYSVLGELLQNVPTYAGVALEPPIMESQVRDAWHHRSETTPERALLVAMVDQAATELRRYKNCTRLWQQRLYAGALRWVISDDREHSHSFLRVCEELDLDVVRTRERLIGPPWDEV